MEYGPQMIALLINMAMKLEREQYLKAKLYERSEERQGVKTLWTDSIGFLLPSPQKMWT